MLGGRAIDRVYEVFRDAFDWWADLLIPAAGVIVASFGVLIALAGVIATAAAVIVALYSSRRATAIAQESENLRARDARERDDAVRRDQLARDEAARRYRLLDTAQEEARALHRYVRLTWGGMPGVLNGQERRQRRDQARLDAMNALETSFLPGASSLFELTEFDLIHAGTTFTEEPEDYARAQENRELQRARTVDRIRAWSLDPEAEAPRIVEELAIALDDVHAYFGQT